LRQASNPSSTVAEAEKGKRFEEYLRLDRLLLGWDCDVHKELLCVPALPTQVGYQVVYQIDNHGYQKIKC
jgi:hypothetical protein